MNTPFSRRHLTWLLVSLGLSLVCPKASGLGPAQRYVPTWPDISAPPVGLRADGALDAAVVIGIEKYSHLPGIPFAAANARDWYRFLVEGKKIPAEKVSLLVDDDASRDAILEAAAVAARSVKPSGTLWVVFIGHGAPAQDGKEGVLVGVDARQTVSGLYAQSVRESELSSVLSKGGEAHSVLVLDACFSGRSASGGTLLPGLQPTIAMMDRPDRWGPNTTVLSAAKSDEFAGPLPSVRAGVAEAGRPAFSYLVLGALRGWGDDDHDGRVTATEAVEYARKTLGALRTKMGRTQAPEVWGAEPGLSLSSGAKAEGPNLTAMVLAGSGGDVPLPDAGSTVLPADTHPAAGMVRIPGGTYSMGSADGGPHERPVHPVNVAPFSIDLTEVTVGAYAACVDASGCPSAPTTVQWANITDEAQRKWSTRCNGRRGDRQNHPINCIDWNAAQSYCAWAGKRLPSEEEWEYAARGTDGRAFPWGDDAPNTRRLNACGDECVAVGERLGQSWTAMYHGADGWEATAPVGMFPDGRSPFGVLDMAGNVAEWTASGYSPDYASARSDAARVIRGGGYHDGDPSLVRASRRLKDVAQVRIDTIGFRCAK